MDFTYKLRNCVLFLIISLILSACSVSQNYQASANISQLASSEQIAFTIKKDIRLNPAYRKGENHHRAKKYIRYVNGIVNQVKNKNISEENARNLLIKTYHQFKSGVYYRNENLMNDSVSPVNSQEIPEITPRYVPDKPGAL